MEEPNKFNIEEIGNSVSKPTTQKQSDIPNKQFKQTKQIDAKQHIILLDFDDTIFPSSYVIENMYCELDNNSGKIKTYYVQDNIRKEFISNLQNVSNYTLELLNKLFTHVKSTQIKIVTNSAKGWVFEALSIASTFCKTYKKIKDLLIDNKIEIMYARDYNNVKQFYWKTKCFDLILSQFNLNKKHNIIISIGDQWGDHHSIKQSLINLNKKQNIFHHQIKFLESPDCAYLCNELKYIKDIIEPYILCNFNNDGIILEFDGYNS
eukprot:247128_1